jgi:methylated-DNA-[protein]-cysteine S-methyltransferase
MTKQSPIVSWCSVHHDNWTFHLAATDEGLCFVSLPNETFETLETWVQKRIPHAMLVHDEERLSTYRMQLDEYFCGQRQEFTLPLDLRGTPFQVQVWNALQQIPFGVTKSYSELAETVGRPAAIRAVGTANGANPVPIVVPCHRVIGKNGTLTGFRGGLDVKAELLKLEGVTPAGASKN